MTVFCTIEITLDTESLFSQAKSKKPHLMPITGKKCGEYAGAIKLVHT